MNVLLTRPEGQNQPMMDVLDKHNIPYWVEPLLVIDKLACPDFYPLLEVATTSMVIFISANAVHFATQALKHAGYYHWPKEIQYFAVGSATLDACERFGIDAISAPKHAQQSEGLLSLKYLQREKVAGKKIKIIRGNGGRDLLAVTLRSLGAQVDYLEVYQRCSPVLDGYKTLYNWQQQGIDTITLSSAANLNNLIALLDNDQSINLQNKQLFSWLHTCHIIVPSERTKQQAIALGFTHVTNAQGADLNAMLSALKL